MSRRWRTRGGVLAAVGVVMATGASLPAAQRSAPSLGAATSFAALGGSTVTNTGLSVITGDVGVSPGTAITGFPPGSVTRGAVHAGDATADRAHRDAARAYASLKGMPSIPANNLTDTDLGGLTLAPGVYKFNSSAQLTGTLTLDANGDSGALFVFQMGTTLTTATNASVVVIDGGADYDESNVFWQAGSSATLGSGTAFTGNILAYASVSLVTGSTLTGSALALNGAVTMEGNVVTVARPVADATIERPSTGRTDGIPPVGAADTDAVVRLDVKHFPARRSRPERSWFRVKARRLEPSTVQTLWADDPSTAATELVQFDSVTTSRSGNFNYRNDTKRGDPMPFGATLADLAGRALEVRDSAGTTTLVAATIPTMSR